MSNFNPNSAFILGEEWPPVLGSSVTLDSATKSVCQSILQTTGQNIGAIDVYVGAIPFSYGVYSVEVFDNENAVPTGLTTLITARPNADGSNVGWTGVPNNAGNLYTNIDEATLDTADYITCTTPTGQTYGATFSIPSLTGKRILAVRLVAVGEVTGAGGTGSEMSVSLIRVGAYGSYVTTLFFNTPGAATLTGPWHTYNGDSRSPGLWTIADVNAYASTSYVKVEFDGGVGIEGSPPPAGTATLYQVYMEILTCDENRLAIGKLDDFGYAHLTANAWNAAGVTTPTGGTWTKDASGRHLYLVRRIAGSGSITIPTLAAASGTPPNPAEGFSPTLEPTYGYVSGMGPATGTVFGLVQRTTAPADSVDSQPYALQVEAKVYNGQTAKQEFTSPGALSVSSVTVRVKPNLAVGDLLIKIKKVSDNSQVGATLTLTAAAAAGLTNEGGSGWRLYTAVMGSLATLSAQQYYLEFSDANGADTGSVNAYWSVLTLDTVSLGQTAGFGGTTDAATINGGRDTRYDIPSTVASVPVPPTVFAAEVRQLALAVPALASKKGCEVDHMDYIHLSWTVTVLGATFLRYEIDRSDDGGVTWNNVAQLTAESLNYWDDYEGLRGVLESYRIRVVRIDLTGSVYSSTVTATCNAEYCELIFTTNNQKALTVAYGHPAQGSYSGSVSSGNGSYTMLDSGAMVLTSMYGRNRQVAFVPTERLGVTFDTDIYINWVATPLHTGIAAFNALRALAEAQGLTIPYVCVLDHEGNRFYAALQVKIGLAQQPGNQQVATVTITEVRDSPLAVVVALI